MELYCNPIADLAGPAIVGYNSLGQGGHSRIAR